MREDEQCVQDLVTCVHQFDSYPFDPASPTLRGLQFAILVPTSSEFAAEFRLFKLLVKKSKFFFC